jgi:dATP pyrophosphohydrolase
MVGGKLENDETAWQAGLRELLEETGCQPVQYWTVPSLNHFYEAKHDRLMLIPVFAAELNDDDDILLNEEHDSCRWLQRDEAEQVMIWPEQIRLIALIDQILRFKTIPDEWIIK